MYKFLWKGIIRDKRRSLLPLTVVAIGVFFVVAIEGIITGMTSNMVNMTARFDTGHLKVVTRTYLENEDQKPNDMAILGADTLLNDLQRNFPQIVWNPRIYFGGLLDIPDKNGETRAQGPVTGTAYDLLSGNSRETGRIGLKKALVKGRLIQHPKETLISNDFAERFGVEPGDTVTFFGSTMYGSMSFTNLAVAGVVRFGNSMLDRGAIILDLQEARILLDMEDAAGEIFGYLPGEEYNMQAAESIKTAFNAGYSDPDDEYAPVMIQLADQNSMGDTIAYMKSVLFVMIFLLILALSIVLWNTGILSGIRRYNEFGIRLAIGEEKGRIYRGLLAESLIIGLLGSCVGTLLAVAVSLLLQKYGISYGSMMDNVSMMIDPVIRSEISPQMFYIGFIPGVLSMLIGTALAGIAVYKRNTAMLFKEFS